MGACWEELADVDARRARLMLREGNGHGDALLVGQYGQVVLLTVREVLA